MTLPDEDSVIEATAKELNLSKEKVNMVVNEFWRGLRYILSNPHLVKAGVTLKGFGKINMRVQKMELFVNKAMFQSKYGMTKSAQYIRDILINYYTKYEPQHKNSPEENVQKRIRTEKYFGRESHYVETDQGTFDILHYKLSKKWRWPQPRRIRK